MPQLAAAGTRNIRAERDFSFVVLSKYFVFAEYMQQVCSKKIEKNRRNREPHISSHSSLLASLSKVKNCFWFCERIRSGLVEMKTIITSSSSFPSCSMRRCWPSSWLLVFLSLFLCVASSRLSKESLHSSSGTSPRTPLGQAERMIKALNLLPSVAEEDFAPIEGPRLQERRIHLDIQGDPGVTPEELGQYAGYFKLERTHAAKMFYFFFESRGKKTEDPVVLWMTGGPGCASELAVFYENGPFKITDNLTLVWNEYGWDKVSNIIFVDQPIGTGFSYSSDLRDIRHNEAGVSEDMFDFFQAFFKAHPEFAKNDFFVTGESYAGHYVPAVTGRLHQAQKKKEGLPINLKGFAIGNGLTQPDIQYEAYADYALDMGLISNSDHFKLGKLYPACAASIKLCEKRGSIACVAAFIICQSIFSSILTISGNINVCSFKL